MTGTGRCGTHWCASLMARVGLRVGHEEVLGYWPLNSIPRTDLDGDVSWPAAGHLDLLPAGTRVAHLVRDPLAIVNSRLGNDKLAPDFSPPTVRDFVARVLGAYSGEHDDRLGHVLWFVTRWDELVRSASGGGLRYRRFRIEDVSSSSLALAELLAHLVPVEWQSSALEPHRLVLDSAIGSLGQRASLTWTDIPDSGDGAQLRAMARRDGYADAP